MQNFFYLQIPELKDDIYVPEYCYYLSEQDDVDSNIDINAWLIFIMNLNTIIKK